MSLYLGEIPIGKIAIGDATPLAASDVFVVNLSWDDDYFDVDEGAWIPNKTFAQIQAAYQDGKTITVDADYRYNYVTADGYFYDGSQQFWYAVNYQQELDNGQWVKRYDECCMEDDNSIFIDYSEDTIYPNFDSPSVTYTPNSSQQTYTITPGSGYNGIGEVNVTINAVSNANIVGVGTTPYTYSTESGQRKWSFTPWLEVDSAGWLSGDIYGFERKFNAVPSNTTITPTESSQTIGGANYMMEGPVTVGAISSSYIGSGITQRSSSDLTANGATVTAPAGYYVAAATKTITNGTVTAPASISGTSATVSTGSNTLTLSKTVSVTPSVTTPGYISSGTAGNSSVSLTANITTQGAQTIHPSSTNQTISSGRYLTGTQTINAVTTSNLIASNIKSGVTIKIGDASDDDCVMSITGTYVGSGGSSGMQIATASATPATASASISFTNLAGDPTSFAVVSAASLATGASPYKTAAVVFDGTELHGQTITNTTNAQVSYDGSGFSKSYSSGTLTITGTGAYFQANEYVLVYTYGGSSANLGTADVQVGSGATSITFTGLSDEPDYFSCIFKSNFSTSSGYQRVITVVYDGTDVYGMEMDSGAKFSDQHWSYTYNNGSLTISSSGTNAGGYFHQPGYYQLTYGVGGNPPTITTESLTVTSNGTYTAPRGKAYTPVIVNVSGSGGGGNSKAIQVNSDAASVHTNGYTSTGISITVAKAGTYNVSWMAWRSSSSGTMGTNLHVNNNTGTNQQTWTNTYGQHITLSNQTYAAGDVLTLYATAGSTSRYCWAGNLIIEEQ